MKNVGYQTLTGDRQCIFIYEHSQGDNCLLEQVYLSNWFTDWCKIYIFFQETGVRIRALHAQSFLSETSVSKVNDTKYVYQKRGSKTHACKEMGK